MKKIAIYRTLTVSLTMLFCCGSVALAQSPEKPNIILIMADDLDSRQLSCYGGQNLKQPILTNWPQKG